MSHLKDTGLSYFAHLLRALWFAWRSMKAAMVLVIHGLFPSCFEHTASGMFSGLASELRARHGDRILVRFNTKFAEDDLKRNWRVLVNGEETLAHEVKINIPCETIVERIATGEIKYHFLCWGHVSFDENHTAIIS